jgi:hypothetical protein
MRPVRRIKRTGAFTDFVPQDCTVASTSDEHGADSVQQWVGKLSRAAADGVPLDVEEKLLPADALRKVLIDPELAADPRGLRIQNAHMTEELDLEHIVFSHPLHLRNCTLEGAIKLAGATIKELNLADSHLQEVDLNNAEVHGDVIANRSVADGPISALNARIGGLLSLNGATIRNADGIALTLDGAQITGGLFADDGFNAEGEVRANAARISRHLSLNGATLRNAGRYALNLDWVQIDGGLYADDGFNAEGEVRVTSARISGQLSLNGATLRNAGGDALNLDWLRIDGGLYAGDGFNAEGKVRANAARIGGQLSLVGATLRNAGGDALTLDGAEIIGGVFARESFEADGVVHAIGARIGGQLSLKGAIFRNPDGIALTLDGAQITGDAFADDGFTAEGVVRAVGAKITGLLSLDGATLRNPDGVALGLDGAEITGGVFARGSFEADGEVRAPTARIEKVFNLEAASLRNPTGYALDVQSATIATLVLTPSVAEGVIHLHGTKIGDLITPEEPAVPLIATGWQVSDIHGPLRENVISAMRWLETDPTSADPRQKTSIQPWHAFAAVYERNGDPTGARKLRYAAAKKLTAQSSGLAKAAGWFYDGLVGHGYHPLRAFGWLAVVVFSGWLVVAAAQKDIVPANMKDAIAAVNDQQADKKTTTPPFTAGTPCESHPTYPCESSFTFAFNALAPTSVSSTDTYWTVRHGAYWLTVVLALLKLFGWALAALLLAGVTGLLRKT